MNDEQPRPVGDSDFDPELIHRIAMHTQARIDARKATSTSPPSDLNETATPECTSQFQPTTERAHGPLGHIWPE